MQEPNVGILLATRVKSNRLPYKILRKIGKYTVFQKLLYRLKFSKYPLIACIAEEPENNVLAKVCEEEGVKYHFGEVNNVAKRLLDVCIKEKLDYFVRVTHDDILIDTDLMHRMAAYASRNSIDYCYVSKIPEGVGVEVIKTTVLKDIVNNKHENTEYLSYYVRKYSKNIKEFIPAKEYQYQFRLTLDYPEDLTLLRILDDELPRNYGTLDIINHLKRHQYLLDINKLPTISIYTVNYNNEKYLEDCISSVLNQTYTDYEYLVIDDHSNDNSAKVILKHANNLKCYLNMKNEGLASSANKAIEKAKGKYIIRIDADDVLEPNALELLIQNIGENDMLFSGYNLTDENLNVYDTVNKNIEHHMGGALVRRSFLNELKFKENIKVGDSQELFSRARESGKIAYLEKPLFKYRRHGNNNTNTLQK